jgi:hypothetical protein
MRQRGDGMICGIRELRNIAVVILLMGFCGQACAQGDWATPECVSISDQDDWQQWALEAAGSRGRSGEDRFIAYTAEGNLTALAEPKRLAPMKGSCIACDTPGAATCAPCPERLIDNTLVFVAGDGWKNIFDDDDNNNFGGRAGFNTAVAVPGPWKLRWQYGMSYGAYDFHGREGLLARDDPIQQQVFGTAGLYKRSDILAGDDLSWGVVYDLMWSDETGERNDDIMLAQLRSSFGVALNSSNEVGVWTAFRLMNDYAEQQFMTVNVTDQANVFWRRHWKYGGMTMLSVGWADDPGETVIGLRGETPLNDRLSLFGNVHYIIPSTTGGDLHPTLPVDDVFIQESWNVSFGLVFHFGPKGRATSVSGDAGLPLLPVADNGSFVFQAPLF